MFTQKLIKIFYPVQEIGLFSLFQNFNLGNTSANPKWRLTISCTTLKSNRHFSTFFTNRPASKSLFQNLNLGNASANPKWRLTIFCTTSCQCQCKYKIWSKYSKRFKCYRHFSTFFTNRPASKLLFQNLNIGNASANSKWHLTISWATSCKYQCVCKILSKYSKWFKSYRHFSRTGRRQNLHKLSGDKIKCLIIGHS